MLDPVHPNLSDTTTTIRFTLRYAQWVTITVRDAHGRIVIVLVNEWLPAGSHTVQWIADRGTPRGTYFYTLETSAGAATRSVTLLK
jgi:hypothetical protein